jgi:hypothetical protein
MEKPNSIDEVISLLNYIDALNGHDNRAGELADIIDTLKPHMEYIESLKIMLDGDTYQDYLRIRNWPRWFKKFLDDKKDDLIQQRIELIKEMRRDTDNIFSQMNDFQNAINI